MTMIIDELDKTVRLLGLANLWGPRFVSESVSKFPEMCWPMRSSLLLGRSAGR